MLLFLGFSSNLNSVQTVFLYTLMAGAFWHVVKNVSINTLLMNNHINP